MEPIRPVLGRMPVAKRLLTAVGVTCPVERLVIEIDAGRPARIYVKAPLDQSVVENLSELFETIRVADVRVGADTSVTFTPAEE